MKINIKKFEKNMKQYDISPKVRFFYIDKKKEEQKYAFIFLHISSYFFIFLHISSYSQIWLHIHWYLFMFYLGALVLPLLRGPLPVPPGRSCFPSVFFYPGRGTDGQRRRTGPFRGGFAAPANSQTPAHTQYMTLASRKMKFYSKSQI